MIRIGNAGGYWGDDPYALRRQLEGPLSLNYITTDFLAELSMSILKKQEEREPGAGYARDITTQLSPLIKTLVEKKVVLVTNAGGMNPRGCAEALLAVAKGHGVALRVAVVEGDDIVGRILDLLGQGESLANSETGESITPYQDKIKAANAYIGALSIAKALKKGPHIVICGRVTDSALTLGPLMHEFGWGPTDFNLLASGVAAGHLIECGAQVTGGNLTDWKRVPHFKDIGFPILECNADGSFVVTKHPGSGGLVSLQTVTEQLVYETFDPKRYYTPDVTADFTSISLRSDGPDRVHVSGVTGYPPPPTLKISLAFADGYKVSGAIIVSGPDVSDKATLLSDLLWSRVSEELSRSSLMPLMHFHTDRIGDNATHLGCSPKRKPNEILLRFSAYDLDREKLAIVRKLIPSLILSGPSGIAVTGGAPAISEIVRYWPTKISRDKIVPKVFVVEKDLTQEVEVVPFPSTPQLQETLPVKDDPWNEHILPSGPLMQVPLLHLAYARSGDKGDTANIGVVARSPACYVALRKVLTPRKVKTWLKDFAHGEIERFPLPNLLSLNFVLYNALDGGGTRSLRIDAQGKTLSQALLRCKIRVPRSLLETIPEELRCCSGEL